MRSGQAGSSSMICRGIVRFVLFGCYHDVCGVADGNVNDGDDYANICVDIDAGVAGIAKGVGFDIEDNISVGVGVGVDVANADTETRCNEAVICSC